jgi:hypothetical protein
MGPRVSEGTLALVCEAVLCTWGARHPEGIFKAQELLTQIRLV